MRAPSMAGRGSRGGSYFQIRNQPVAWSLFEYLRNEKLDARNFFALAGGSKPPYKLNQFGASLGGPVMLPHYNGKSRTFFFTDYEGYREVFGSPLVVTVPTAAARAGNFQGLRQTGFSIH